MADSPNTVASKTIHSAKEYHSLMKKHDVAPGKKLPCGNRLAEQVDPLHKKDIPAGGPKSVKQPKHASEGLTSVLNDSIYHPQKEITRLPQRKPSIVNPNDLPVIEPEVPETKPRFHVKKKPLVEAPFATGR
eukprot:TRINITY_DN90229_c0_g1_i1.p1 TRINITY_DN90229_c0_g1~~TRINITY_DN90229_c0_g1_i1.p1  ORF type:complete len:132 (+),score=8.61 TRINITY_DN90229_c0_g1_i1:153-548(+)